MAKIVKTVCDQCGSLERPTTAYKVSRKGAARTLDLCKEHGKVLEDMIGKKAKYSTGAARRTADTIVATVEDVQRLAEQADEATADK
jgi:hypothetical protein